MALNSEVSVYRGIRELHLIMRGDFDRALAHELAHSLRRNYIGQQKVFFHTNRLQQVHHSGIETFLNHLRSLPVDPGRLFFTGDNASHMAPDGSTCL